MCGVVCGDNNKAVRCNSVVVVIHKVIGLLWITFILVGWVVDRVEGLGNEKTLAWALPSEKRSFCDSILTDLHTLTIHISVYSIPVFLTI